MGCVSSKDSIHPTAKASWYSNCLPPCGASRTSARTQPTHEDSESCHVVSLTFSSYGALSMERPPCPGSFLSLSNETRKYQAIGTGSVDQKDDLVCWQGLDMKHAPECIGRKPMKEEKEQDASLLNGNGWGQGRETISPHEFMDDLHECRSMPSQYYFCGGQKLRVLNKTLSFKSMQKDAASSPLWLKRHYTEPESATEISASGGILPLRPPSSPSISSCESTLLCMAYVESSRKPPSCTSLMDEEDCRSISSREDVDEDTSGLKLLVSPVHPTSDLASPLAKKAGLHETSLCLDANAGHIQKKGSINGSPTVRKRRLSWQLGKASSLGSDIPSFDPTLLATFELAVMAMPTRCDDEWLQQGTEKSTTNSSLSGSSWASAETVSDAESMPQWDNQDKHSSTPSLMPNKEEINNKGSLVSYHVKCPPRGDGKVVLYHTSMRGIRKTYEDCCTVRLILKGLGVHVEERDVWMHSKFREELVHTMGDDIGNGVPLLPCLFINGSYIGSAEEVKKLHEDGRLSSLMEGIAMDTLRRVCDGCGDVRFVVCVNCNGSCKVLLNQYTREVTRCLMCNENGLIMCPVCTV